MGNQSLNFPLITKDGCPSIYTIEFTVKNLPKSIICCCYNYFSCTVVKTQHHITLDHNITIKIEKEVNNFLDDLYDEEPTN